MTGKAPSTHFIPPWILPFLTSDVPPLRQCCHPQEPSINGARYLSRSPLSCVLRKNEKKKLIVRLFIRVMGMTLLGPAADTLSTFTALVIGRGSWFPADTAVHCVVKLGILYPRSVTVKRVRFLASRAPKFDLRS